MKLTATEKAEKAALQVIVWARKNDQPITRDMVDRILSRDADTSWGDANVRTVRQMARKLATLSTDVVALTDREEYWLHRARFARMNRDELDALGDEIADEKDPRGNDKNFVNALSVARKFYAPTYIPGPRVHWKTTPAAFLAQLRANGCKAVTDTEMSGQGRTYIKATHVDGGLTYDLCIVFDNEEGFVRAFQIGRRCTYRSMAATKRALGIKEDH